MSEPGESKKGKGSSGHPEPGSAHDDTKTETIAQGPDVPRVDGVPGAHCDVETRGGADIESNTAGEAVEVSEEMGS